MRPRSRSSPPITASSAASLPELEAAADRVAAALKSASLSPQRAAAAAAELDNVRHDLEFLQTANNVHNMHYAAKLCQALVDRLSALCRELKIAGPKVSLPPPMKGD